MSRPDVRIWGPAVVAALCLAPRALPEPAAERGGRAQSLALPPMRSMPERARERRFELDAGSSSVRFLVEGRAGELLVRCTRNSGTLTIGPEATDGALALDLELASLEVVAAVGDAPTLRQVLGVLGDAPLQLRHRRVAVERSDLPGVQLDTWIGTVRLGARVLQQPVQLWRSTLPGPRMRSQGHGTVVGGDFGLPDRPWLALFDERYRVTLGLDLAWRRRGGD